MMRLKISITNFKVKFYFRRNKNKKSGQKSSESVFLVGTCNLSSLFLNNNEQE